MQQCSGAQRWAPMVSSSDEEGVVGSLLSVQKSNGADRPSHSINAETLFGL